MSAEAHFTNTNTVIKSGFWNFPNYVACFYTNTPVLNKLRQSSGVFSSANIISVGDLKSHVFFVLICKSATTYSTQACIKHKHIQHIQFEKCQQCPHSTSESQVTAYTYIHMPIAAYSLQRPIAYSGLVTQNANTTHARK